ncbi:MAG: acyl-ACP--UDP-N-acetylglucosamine O-acyltransferase [Candidatus Riflebacteria bacterium]|nr:acyl-ACP--UDP-N-acetylglucosamine O-acyltransferase [Candidatus Riflebacteria bacterium]
MTIHPTAIVAASAKIHPSAEIGPYAFIGPNVEIGENTTVGHGANIDGWTTIGKNNVIHRMAVIGAPPQDLKYKGERSFVKIGDGNHFREFSTVHLAEGEDQVTEIGNNNLFMAYVHIAHNCKVGNNNIMSNNVSFAGHAQVGDRAVLGGFSAFHQFTHVGDMCMVGGMSKVTKDVPPFTKIDGNPVYVIGLNAVGLRRNNVPRESIINLKNLYKVFFRSDMNVSQVLERWNELVAADDPYVQKFYEFIKNSNRGVCKKVRVGVTSASSEE